MVCGGLVGGCTCVCRCEADLEILNNYVFYILLQELSLNPKFANMANLTSTFSLRISLSLFPNTKTKGQAIMSTQHLHSFEDMNLVWHAYTIHPLLDESSVQPCNVLKSIM